MRLLMIEDNIELCKIVKRKLTNMSYQVDLTHNGEAGKEHIAINEYDLILLDLNLPDMDGMEILTYVRESPLQVPVIILTGREDLDTKLQGFGLGADDYIEKPFEIRELEARIQAVVRRSHGRVKAVLQVNDLQLHMHDKKVFYRDQEIRLMKKEYEILEYLMLEHPRFIPSEELMEHVYDEYVDPFSSALRVHIARLRKKLLEGCGKEVLKTIRGRGYSLCD